MSPLVMPISNCDVISSVPAKAVSIKSILVPIEPIIEDYCDCCFYYLPLPFLAVRRFLARTMP